MALDRTLPDQNVHGAQYPNSVAVLWHLMGIADRTASSSPALMVCRLSRRPFALPESAIHIAVYQAG